MTSEIKDIEKIKEEISFKDEQVRRRENEAIQFRQKTGILSVLAILIAVITFFFNYLTVQGKFSSD